MRFDDVLRYGAKTRMSLESAEDEVRAALDGDMPDEVGNEYQEIKEEYGEAISNVREAGQMMQQEQFPQNSEAVIEAVDLVQDASDIFNEVSYDAKDWVNDAHDHAENVESEGTDELGFPEATPQAHLSQAMGHVEDAEDFYREAQRTVELGLTDETPVQYHDFHGLQVPESLR